MTQEDDGSAPMLGSVANRLAASLRDMDDEIFGRGADYSNILFEAARELDRRSWIPVTERLPEDGVPVAIVADRGRTPDNRGVVAAGELYRGCWYHTLPGLVSRQIADVTHWMPLPAPPTDGK